MPAFAVNLSMLFTELPLIERFEAQVDQVLAELSLQNLSLATRCLALVQGVRGFGHVRRRNTRQFAQQADELMARIKQPAQTVRIMDARQKAHKTGNLAA